MDVPEIDCGMMLSSCPLAHPVTVADGRATLRVAVLAPPQRPPSSFLRDPGAKAQLQTLAVGLRDLVSWIGLVGHWVRGAAVQWCGGEGMDGRVDRTACRIWHEGEPSLASLGIVPPGIPRGTPRGHPARRIVFQARYSRIPSYSAHSRTPRESSSPTDPQMKRFTIDDNGHHPPPSLIYGVPGHSSPSSDAQRHEGRCSHRVDGTIFVRRDDSHARYPEASGPTLPSSMGVSDERDERHLLLVDDPVIAVSIVQSLTPSLYCVGR